MAEQVQIEFFDACGTGGRSVTIDCTMRSNSESVASVEMRAKFIRQSRQYRRIAIGPVLGIDDVNLWWIIN
jgi:hypothetical protein